MSGPQNGHPRLRSLARSAFRAVRGSSVGRRALFAPFQAARRWGVHVPHRIYKHLPYEGPFSLELAPGFSINMVAHAHAIENGLYWEGIAGHEPETLATWIALARRSQVVFDVGANTGLFALAANGMNASAEVHAFEPIARIAALLRQNVSMNPGFHVTVHEAAVGGEDATLPIHDPGGDNCYSASLDPDFLKNTAKRSYEIPVVTLDRLVRDHGIPGMDLVKIDVEGYEEPALAGMAESIARFRPVIVLELIDQGVPRPHLDGVLSSGYRIREIGSHSHAAPSKGDARNVLLIPREREASVEAALLGTA